MKKGFTLIELLIVVLIIGILAAIALPQYQTSVAKTRYASLLNLTNGLVEAERNYYSANSRYSSKFDDLDITMPEGGTLTAGGYGSQFMSYDWGYCAVNDGYSGLSAVAMCSNTKNIYYVFLDINGNGKYCLAKKDDKYALKVCSALAPAAATGWGVISPGGMINSSDISWHSVR